MVVVCSRRRITGDERGLSQHLLEQCTCEVMLESGHVGVASRAAGHFQREAELPAATAVHE